MAKKAKNKQQIKIEGDITGLKKAMREGASSVSSLNKELKLNQVQLKGTNDKVSTLKDRLKILNDTYDKQKQVVEENEEAYKKSVELYGENSKEAKDLANQLTDNKTKLQKFKNEIDDTNKKIEEQTNKFITNGKKIEEIGDKWQKAGDKMNKVGNVISVVGAGIAGGLAVSAKAAIDYESAFAGVEKTVDATEEQLQELNKGILDMSTRMPAAATEIAGVAESAGQLGIETDNILSFSEAMIGLGESTNLTAEEASSQLAKFANIMKMSQSDFDKLGSSIVDLGNHFQTTEADIVNMAMRLAGAGKQVGLNEGQVMGLATALSSVGIEAEMGGSAISKAMVKMQNAVDLGGGKMQAVLKKTGMSLHDMEIIAANDSMTFKSLATSLDMTSTELKQMITAGTNLEDFAKVSGMTAEQFKKAWKEDAAGALSAFIQGLGHAEDKGESAITMLSEMGLTEVRLRDSLLRAANAGDLFNNAIETGTKAWKENKALTNEVNKRYGTTESQMKMLKNEAKKLAIEFGRQLVPSLRSLLKDAKPILNTVSDAIKKFSNLDDKTKQNTKKILALTVALGPLTKAAGKVITVGGSTIKTIGTVTQAIGVMTGKATSSSTAVNSLAGMLSKIISPMGLVTTAVTVAGGALAYFKLKNEESENKMRAHSEELQNAVKAQQDYNASIDESTNSELAHLDRISKLKDELGLLLDENGNVKHGYEERAEYIMKELNEALGTEYDLNKDIKNSYKEISDEIDKLIERKKADIIMAGEAKKWENAYNDQAEATKKAAEEYNNLKNAASGMGDSLEDFYKNVELADKQWNDYLNHAGEHTTLMEKYNKATVEYAKELISNYDNSLQRIKDNDETMKQYDQKLVAYTKRSL